MVGWLGEAPGRPGCVALGWVAVRGDGARVTPPPAPVFMNAGPVVAEAALPPRGLRSSTPFSTGPAAICSDDADAIADEGKRPVWRPVRYASATSITIETPATAAVV